MSSSKTLIKKKRNCKQKLNKNSFIFTLCPLPPLLFVVVSNVIRLENEEEPCSCKEEGLTLCFVELEDAWGAVEPVKDTVKL